MEDYVKVIYAHTEWQDKPLNSSQLALKLGVANSSVSEMVRKLVELGLVDHQPYAAVRLTAVGYQLALSMVRRHRLIETFLARELGYSWDQVHDEAETLEHAVSERFVDRLAERLGNPDRDPHGDPIPGADGVITIPTAHQLTVLDAGHQGQITRISDENPLLLRYLEQERITLDSAVEVVGRKPFGGSLVVRLEGQDHQLRELDVSDEVGSALWIADTREHVGCTVGTSREP